MLRLAKITRTRYVIGKGKDTHHVRKGMPDARKVVEKSPQWYAVGTENGRKVRIPLATDKEVAQTMLGDLIRKRELGQAAMVSPYESHNARPVAEHVADYLATLRTADVSDKHYAEKERLLNAVLDGCEVKNLPDLTADKVEKFLGHLDASARTKDTYRSAVYSFAKWLVRHKRLEHNPIDVVEKPQGDPVRVRRALTPEQLQSLLNTTRQRPLIEFSKIRRGKRKGETTANLKPEFRAKLELLGRERALIYKMAIFTGLRRGEIAALKVAHLNLDAKPYPYLELGNGDTKNGQKARLLLVPAYAQELRQWITDTRKQPADTLFAVRNEMVKNLKADLKEANIPYKDELGRQADFHSLRMSADTLLGIAGVAPRVRQLFMRHSDIRLTLETYDDSSLYELQAAVKALENLDLK